LALGDEHITDEASEDCNAVKDAMAAGDNTEA